jgi:hypothetical protein
MNDESKFNYHSIALDQARLRCVSVGSGDPVLNGEGLAMRGHDWQGIVRMGFLLRFAERT